jgi:hypothetical protein
VSAGLDVLATIARDGIDWTDFVGKWRVRCTSARLVRGGGEGTIELIVVVTAANGSSEEEREFVLCEIPSQHVQATRVQQALRVALIRVESGWKFALTPGISGREVLRRLEAGEPNPWAQDRGEADPFVPIERARERISDAILAAISGE